MLFDSSKKVDSIIESYKMVVNAVKDCKVKELQKQISKGKNLFDSSYDLESAVEMLKSVASGKSLNQMYIKANDCKGY
ncbi:hypothetical protein DCO58_02155 [Helicobacter saguini]|uniref:Uncharacterized protein n=1 Tax=Helicobacter saguini TaxID=1548018 RepID=A0A099BG50_9HELI|nr:hypothetical protein [Helicobacter saguini]MWV62821.1 hypothetical protein [Helicobacter saguini]MWV66510.1 hypothetical protein [Helicobacter saguini]MWV68859.1 hypothetical protein [Helicobacter saguini]MWV71586.1 hypothetical protein [Helicobacter saguini]TLD94392.1 hypothetical protein LS64_005520 [Helicobacter saguini]